jgi:hypothetical protein
MAIARACDAKYFKHHSDGVAIEVVAKVVEFFQDLGRLVAYRAVGLHAKGQQLSVQTLNQGAVSGLLPPLSDIGSMKGLRGIAGGRCWMRDDDINE